MTDKIKSAILKTAEALEAELHAGKHLGNEQAVKAAIEEAKKAAGSNANTERPNRT